MGDPYAVCLWANPVANWITSTTIKYGFHYNIMPNGTELSQREFNTLEEPLRQSDDIIKCFANRIGGKVMTCQHGYPQRVIRVSLPRGIGCAIYIIPSKKQMNIGWVPNNIIYIISLGVAKKKEKKVLMWDCVIKKLHKYPPNDNMLNMLLERCWSMIHSVNEKDLKLLK